MKRPLLALLIILVPILLFANVVQAFRYGRLERRVQELEREQLALIEENKRAILAISVLTSPDRIGELAEDVLGLERIEPSAVTRVRTPRRDGAAGEEAGE